MYIQKNPHAKRGRDIHGETHRLRLHNLLR